MAKQHDKQFKLDAIQYYEDHKELGLRGCANNLGIGYSTLTKWRKELRDSGDIVVRGSGNYESDEQKEIAKLYSVTGNHEKCKQYCEKSKSNYDKLTPELRQGCNIDIEELNDMLANG